MLKEYDLVKANEKLSNKVNKGDIGTILLIYNEPHKAYEVEFVDKHNNTIEVLTVLDNKIEKYIDLSSKKQTNI